MKKFSYPLIQKRLFKEEIKAGISVLNSGQITISKITRNFEKNFAKYIGSKYALMVNSGSSANLLATCASCNPKRLNRLKRGDEVLIPGICWSTSLWPIVQFGLKPIFVDVDKDTLNLDINDLKKKITQKTKMIFLVHVLGNSTNLKEIKKIVKKKKLILIEDTCESLGSEYNSKKLGSFGDFSTFSFYYSHQISSGEGGMVACNSTKDYEILLSLRAHGWSRDGKDHKKIVKKYKNLDPRFIFINYGFNLRPTEIQAAIASRQLKKINIFKKNRIFNRNNIIKFFNKNKFNNDKIKFIKDAPLVKSNWFGIPMLLNENLKLYKKKILQEIESEGIETRPIISGNFLNQPAIDLFNLNPKKKKLKNAQNIEERGFFIGIDTKKSPITTLKFVADKLNKVLKKYNV